MLRIGFVVLAIAAVVFGYPAVSHVEDPELTAGYFQGDMKMRIDGRNGLINPLEHWPNKIVYFNVSESFDDAHYNHIIKGLRIIESVSCIRFLPAQPKTEAYIYVTGDEGGCYSEVGYLGVPQQLNFALAPLDTGCFRIGTIVHEFLHALGFFHQQSATDRDEFVTIVEENLIPELAYNFDKYNETYITDFGVEYDYGSVLHYPEVSFSKNGLPTIVPKQKGVEIGQRRGLSPKDIYKLNLMYKCPNQS